MKRCPQCEFIYEDDQSLCDMDGALLVFDSRTLPNLHALAPVELALAPKVVHSRPRILPAMAALILATVLSLVYLVSTQRTAPAPAAVTTPISNSLTPSEANHTPATPAAEVNAGAATTSKEESKPESTKPTPAAPAAKKATVKAPTARVKPTPEPKKDDSKVGSILKKTGRILKKPFKF